EIRAFDDVPVGEARVKENELKLATQLIEQSVSEQFQPEKYHDQVQLRLEALIADKVAGKEIRPGAYENPRGQINDLMQTLKASLGQPPASRGRGKSAANESAVPSKGLAKTAGRVRTSAEPKRARSRAAKS